MVRAIHCCYGDTWAARLGGVLALEALAKRMPPAQLLQAGVHATKALFAVLRSLPENAVQEQHEITEVLLNVLRRALLPPCVAEREGAMAGDQDVGTPSDAGGLSKQASGDHRDGVEGMDVDQDDTVPTNTRRSKRAGRRGGTQPPKKKLQRQSPMEDDQTSPKEGEPDKPAGLAMPPSGSDTLPSLPTTTPGRESGKKPFARGIQESLLQAVLSGKSNDAVRSAATSCLQVFASVTGTTVGAISGSVDKMGRSLRGGYCL